MLTSVGAVPKHRNRNYEETHVLLIEKAGELISESGADGVSVSALARVTGINRSTIYYHFDAREDLMSAAQQWSREKSAKDADVGASRWVGIDDISSLFRTDPDVVSSWIDNYIAEGDIRERYPQWDRLVAKIGDAFAELAPDEPCDSEIYCALMLTSAFKSPRAFTDSDPLAGLERILDHLHAEQQRTLPNQRSDRLAVPAGPEFDHGADRPRVARLPQATANGRRQALDAS